MPTTTATRTVHYSVLARSLMNQHGLNDWRLTFGSAQRTAGTCKYGTRTLNFSRVIMDQFSDAERLNTILHEIAHALAGHAAGHGPEWRRVARSIGCDARRTYSGKSVQTNYKWLGTCPNGHTIKKLRLTARSTGSSCPKCSPRYDARFVFRWTQLR